MMLMVTLIMVRIILIVMMMAMTMTMMMMMRMMINAAAHVAEADDNGASSKLLRATAAFLLVKRSHKD